MSTTILFPGRVPAPFFCGNGTAFPDHDLVSFDDEQVKAILLKLEIPALFVAPKAAEPMLRCVTDDRHPTHRLLFARWTGSRSGGDNGYVMLGYQRSHHSEADFCRNAKEFLETYAHPASIRRIEAKGLS